MPLFPFPTHSICVDGLNIRYCTVGKGEPLLLVHGLGAMLEYWHRNIAYWSQYYQVIALDLPGFGESDPPPWPPDVDHYVDFIRKFIEAFHVQPGYVVAHSLGGLLMLAYAIQYPTTLKKLVLLDNAGFSTQLSWHFRILTIPGIRSILMNFSREQYAASLSSHVYEAASLSQDFINTCYAYAKEPKSKQHLLEILSRHASLFGIKEKAIAPIKQNLFKLSQLPILIFWGKEDPILHFEPHTTLAKQLLPHATLIPLEQCGHIPQIEHSDLINEKTVQFFRE